MRLAALLLVIASAAAGSDAVSPEDAEFFEERVRPLLAARCYECHSDDADRVEGALKLDSRAAAFAGGDSGPAIDAEDVQASWLLDAVRGETYEMPPSGPLPAGETAVFEEWFRRGAPWPEDGVALDEAGGFDLEARRASHWCWQPVADAEPPAVDDAAWCRDPVDAFVLAKLEAAGLEPAAEASREVWLRRATFATRGLPPTPGERAAFLADESPGAYETVVDRLLAEPQFGETWGRHWLDVVRYAETYGHEFDYPIPHAAEFRDYVIRAVNADVPWDRFAREQIAGDLIGPRPGPGGVNEAEVATGFWFLGEAVHAPTDGPEDEATRVENQIDTYSKAFLGLTAACARCHDHKFDAISAEDYYALFGVMKSTRRRLATLDPGGRIAAAVAEVDRLRAELPPVDAEAETIELRDGDAALPDVSRWDADGAAWVVAGTPQWDWQRSRAVAAGVASTGPRAGKLAGTLRSPPFTLTGQKVHLRMRTDFPEKAGPTVRLVVGGFFMHEFHDLLYKGTIRRNVSTGGEWGWVTLEGDLGRFAGETCHVEVSDPGEGVVELSAAMISDAGPPKVVAPPRGGPSVAGPAFAGATRDRLAAAAEAIPAGVRRLAAGDGPGVDEGVHVRGNAHRVGAAVARRGLAALDSPAAASGSGRLELAERTTAADNPLFARVAVNRVWHHLFGRGIVASVDDFGVMGDRPSHPRLLDRLATDFREDGYSLKRLVRRLLLTSTYRMSSEARDPARAAVVDADNTLLHKAPVRRLTAEAIQDSLLAVAGRIDLSPMSGSVAPYQDAFATGRGKKAGGPLDNAGRRAVYTGVRRNFLPAGLRAFDFPTPLGPIGRRTVSTVPAQSLAMLNGPLVGAMAERTGARVCAEATTFAGRLERLTLLCFGRGPTAEERDRVRAFVGGDGDAAAWADVAHALFNAKEFIYLR